jgi:hypothetical protein
MAKKQPEVGAWFIEQRTRSLATVYLTRRDDLDVTEAAEADGVDLTVTIKARKEAANRRFGLVLQGARPEMTVEEVNAVLKPALVALSVRAFPYPVCLFFFTMEHDRGYYTWVAEPMLTGDGSPALAQNREADGADLDTTALATIVARVNQWYDAFYSSMTNGGKESRKKNGLEVLHGIIDGEADYVSEHGNAPRLLRLPIPQAYALAKLGREHLGDLAGQIVKEGVRVLEKDGLLGMQVKLVTEQQDFSFE